MIAARLLTYTNGSEYIEITYLKEENENVTILIEVASQKVVSVNGVSTRPEQPTK